MRAISSDYYAAVSPTRAWAYGAGDVLRSEPESVAAASHSDGGSHSELEDDDQIIMMRRLGK